MAITKIHAVKVRLGDAINYIENPDKTDGQELISGYNTAPQTAVLDFSVTAAMAHKARNASAKKQGNLAYHLIQSFPPDDAVTPEQAHELGRKLAMEFTMENSSLSLLPISIKILYITTLLSTPFLFMITKSCALFPTAPRSESVVSRIGSVWKHSCLLLKTRNS